MPDSTPTQVHNHGSEDGPGLACRESVVDGKRVGACLAPTPSPAPVEARTTDCERCGEPMAKHGALGCFNAMPKPAPAPSREPEPKRPRDPRATPGAIAARLKTLNVQTPLDASAPAVAETGEPLRVTARQIAAVFGHPCANPDDCPACRASAVERAHARLLDLVLSRKYSGASLQKAIRDLIAAAERRALSAPAAGAGAGDAFESVVRATITRIGGIHYPMRETIEEAVSAILAASRLSSSSTEATSATERDDSWHGCMTGDCPHETADGCAAELREYVRELHALLASRSAPPGATESEDTAFIDWINANATSVSDGYDADGGTSASLLNSTHGRVRLVDVDLPTVPREERDWLRAALRVALAAPTPEGAEPQTTEGR